MLFRQKLEAELESKKQEFIEFAQKQQGEMDSHASLLERLAKIPVKDILSLIEEKKIHGAVPSAEIETYSSVGIAFGNEWSNHEEARKWAMGVLKDRTTFAADASQLLLDREINFPTGVIQIGWFENDHKSTGSYDKLVRSEVLSPKDLLDKSKDGNFTSFINVKRLEAEIAQARDFIERKRGWQGRGERMPLAFFDGTWMLPKDILNENLYNAVNLVKASSENQVPLIGYVDISKTRDLVNLLGIFAAERGDDIRIFDAQVMNTASTLKKWGDRSIFFYTERERLEEFLDQEGKPLVGFVHLRMAGSGQPPRVDIPSWIYEAGLLDEVIDVIRAECIIGAGYPYPIEAADATAVINASDREIFLKALQNFAEGSKIPFRISPKPQSKARRR